MQYHAIKRNKLIVPALKATAIAVAANKREAEPSCLALLQACDAVPKLAQLHGHV